MIIYWIEPINILEMSFRSASLRADRLIPPLLLGKLVHRSWLPRHLFCNCLRLALVRHIPLRELPSDLLLLLRILNIELD